MISKYSALGMVFLISISCINAMEDINEKNMKLDELQELNVALPLCNNKNSINNAIKIVYNLGQHTEDISAACFSPNKVYCALGSSDGCIYIYNSDSSELYCTVDTAEPVTALCWSHDSSHLIVGSKIGLLGVYDVKNKKEAACFSCSKNSREISSLSISPFSVFLVLGFSSGEIMILDAEKAARDGNWKTVILKYSIQGHEARVTSLCFDTDNNGKLWLASCAGKEINIWDFEESEEKRVRGIRFTNTAEILSICFNPNSKSIASGSADNTIKIWNVGKNKKGNLVPNKYEKPLYILSGHSDAVSSVQYNSSGSLLLSGSHDKTVKIWDMKAEKPKELKTLEMKSKACHLELSRDDMYILTGLENRDINITTFAKNDMVRDVMNTLHDKKENIDIFITKIFPSLPIITKELVRIAMKNSSELSYLLPKLSLSKNS